MNHRILILSAAIVVAVISTSRAADPIAVPDRTGINATVPNAAANQLLTDLHRINAHEIEMGKLAQSKSPDQSVRDYGHMLVQHHEAAQKKVIALASDRNISLGQANELTTTGQNATTHKNSQMSKLDSLKGEAFDRGFLKDTIEGHSQTLKKLRSSAAKLTNAPEVSALANGLIPVIEKHLGRANELVQQVGKKNAQPN
jgi:putative membrane protein